MNKKKALLAFAYLLTLFSCLSFSSITDKPPLPNRIEPHEDILTGPAVCALLVFQGVSINNTTYLNWEVSTKASNYYFMLLKSETSADFKILSIQRGYPCLPASGLMYSFADSASCNNAVSYYKLLAFPAECLNRQRNLLSVHCDVHAQIIKVERNKVDVKYDLVDRIPLSSHTETYNARLRVMNPNQENH